MNRAALLLADPSPSLRCRVLRDLMARPAGDPEVQELESLRSAEPLAVTLFDLQREDGSWNTGLHTAARGAGPVYHTAIALMRLGYLGFGPETPAVQRGAAYLFEQQQADGSWPLPRHMDEIEEGETRSGRQEGYAMMPMQTSIPLRGLAACGLAADPRAEKAYDWLLAQRLPDGAWPTGLASAGVHGFVAGYRRLPHSRWGCRSNTTGALACLALHPERCRQPEARRGLDLLLGRETRDEYALGYDTARLVGVEPAHGFTTFYGRFDLGQLLGLCARIGASLEDERVRSLAEYIRGLQGPYGLWQYRRQPQVSRWVTFDLLRSLARLDENAHDWQTFEPRTPFTPYPKKQKRF